MNNNKFITPIRFGHIFDNSFGTGYAGNVWNSEYICPTLQTMQGGARQPLVIIRRHEKEDGKNYQNSQSTEI